MNLAGVAQAAVVYPSPLGQEGAAGIGKSNAEAKDSDNLTPEEIKQVEELKARDREVRAHEQAHLAAAGGLAMSGASFTYQRGPDGVSYAIGGEVKIDTSPGNTPDETIRRAQIIRAAALAPAEPSGQDRAVAAKATQMEAAARTERAAQQADNTEVSDGQTGPGRDGKRLEQMFGMASAATPGGLVDIQA